MEVRKLFLDELGRPDVDRFSEIEKLPVVVLLDNIRSGMNVGSVFRTADALLVKSIYLSGISATPPHKEILKAAIGANETVHWKYFETSEEAVQKLKKQGYFCVGVEQTTASQDIRQFDFKYPLALVFGNEVNGVSDEILPLLDAFIEVPQYGTKHSFNVSVCAGIVLWEAFLKSPK